VGKTRAKKLTPEQRSAIAKKQPRLGGGSRLIKVCNTCHIHSGIVS
jgi:hypothetical protein